MPLANVFNDLGTDFNQDMEFDFHYPFPTTLSFEGYLMADNFDVNLVDPDPENRYLTYE